VDLIVKVGYSTKQNVKCSRTCLQDTRWELNLTEKCKFLFEKLEYCFVEVVQFITKNKDKESQFEKNFSWCFSEDLKLETFGWFNFIWSFQIAKRDSIFLWLFLKNTSIEHLQKLMELYTAKSIFPPQCIKYIWSKTRKYFFHLGLNSLC